MPKRKKKRTKTKRNSLAWVTLGLVQIVFALLAISKIGWLGRQSANVIRLFVGDSYLLICALLLLFSLVMIIYNQPAHLKLKRSLGLALALWGVLLLQSGAYFAKEQVNVSFMNSFWQAMVAEFGRANITHNLGGGLLGALSFQILAPLLGQLGLRVLAAISLPVGLLMFFDVKYRTLVEKFEAVSQRLIKKNQSAGQQLKNKYGQLRQRQLTRKEDKTSNRQQLSDPLAEDQDQTFPDVTDFATDETTTPGNAPETNEAVRADSEPNSEAKIVPAAKTTPQIQIAAENENSQAEQATDALPPAHIFADEDRQLKAAAVTHDSSKQKENPHSSYQRPPLSLLAPVKKADQSEDKQLIHKNTRILQSTFKSFGVRVLIKKAILGPTITRYEVQPAVGVKVSRIVNLADDLALALAAKDIRIEAPIPGKPFIGIEVPNRNTSIVSFKDVMAHQSFKAKHNPMIVPLGKNVTGQTVSANLTKMPHLLIAGSTGSGKSVAINTILTSILMKARPEEVKLVLIDPKMVELSVYNGVPHLLIPVVTDAKLAASALHKVVKEMERRYQLFAASATRNMAEYNAKVAQNNQDKNKPVMQKLPYILVVVDELSDLMMVGGHDVEDAIVRLGQMARAAGIHMILATQRPSVDVITGLIKANVPSRISFAVSSGVDSRTILDQTGAEKLLGRGDMLYLPIGAAKPERIQGAYITSQEVERVIAWVKKQQKVSYNQEMMPQAGGSGQGQNDEEPEDEFYQPAVDLVRKQQTASVSMLQRRFRIGYNRAARIVDAMEAKGVVGPSEGSKPRQVLIPPKKEDKHDQH